MDEKNVPYCMPEGFNLFSAADTVRGLADAIHYTVLEGAGTDAQMSRGDKAGLNSLVELLQEHVHALHDYLTSIENRTTLRLPMSEADFEAIHVKYAKKTDGVREEAPLYLVR